MLFTSRRMATFVAWVLNHLPFIKHDFEIQVFTIDVEPPAKHAEWSPEDAMHLQEILDKDAE